MLDGNKAYTKTINDWLENNSKQTTGTWASNNMPGLTPKEVIENTQYVKNFFKSTPLDKSFNIFWDGELQRGTGTVGEMASQLGWDSDEVQVKNTLFHTTAAFGEPTLQLTVVGKKDGKNVSKEIILPYSNIRNKQMDQYFNSPGYLLQMEMNLHKHTGAESAQMVVYGPDGKPLENRDATASFKGNSDKITIFDPLGTDNYKTIKTECSYIDLSPDAGQIHGSGHYKNGTAALSGIRLFANSGTPDSGTFKLNTQPQGGNMGTGNSGTFQLNTTTPSTPYIPVYNDFTIKTFGYDYSQQTA